MTFIYKNLIIALQEGSMSEIFNGLEELGFKKIDIDDIYGKDKEKIKVAQKHISEKNPLYLTTVCCPVCGNNYKEKAVKSSSSRIASKDTDLFIRYDIINPYFYDVWICNKCGYSALKVDFPKIREGEIELISEKITPKFKPKIYPEFYDLDIAIERYKMALINAVYMESKWSRKAIICLKLAWMYRLMNSENGKEMERVFLKEAVKGLEEAYMKESFPLYGMDNLTTMYLIAEIHRRLGNHSVALTWFSNLITSKGVKPNLKELARTQKDLVKEELLLVKKLELNGELLNDESFDLHHEDKLEGSEDNIKMSTPKKSFFKLFK